MDFLKYKHMYIYIDIQYTDICFNTPEHVD